MTGRPASEDGWSVARRSVRGVAWNYASFGLGKLLVFLTTAVLARLLTPADFGLVAIATLAVSYLAILRDLGLGAALIQRREGLDEAAETVFTLNLALGVLLAAAAYAIAPALAGFFHEPQAGPVLRWLALSFPLNALGSVHVVRLQRELDFRRKLIPDLGRSIVKGSTAIVLAVMGHGVWALVIGQLAGALAGSALAWWALAWRPRLRIQGRLVKQLLRFGGAIVALNALSVVTDNLAYLFVGRVLGNEALGVYTLAYRLPELLVLNTLWILAGVLFPAYSKVQGDPEALRQGFLTSFRYLEVLIVPVCLGLMLAADPLVRVAFGPQWLEAIPILRLLAAFALVRSLGSSVGDIYKAIGRPDILVKLAGLNLVLFASALWVGSRHGLRGVATALVVVGCLATFARLLVATRFIDVTWADMIVQLRPAAVGGLILVGTTAPTAWVTQDLPPSLRLVLLTTVGAASYVTCLWFVERQAVQRLLERLRPPAEDEKEKPQ
jgi:PST family polysaccharide transporter